MAFTIKNQKPVESVATQPNANPDSENKQEQDSLAFLNAKKNIRQEVPNDPYTAEVTEKGSHQYTLKTLNALKIVSPIICALMEKPGVDAPNEEMSESFRHLIQETSSIAESFCEKMGVDPKKPKNFWIRNVLEKSFAEILRTQWINNNGKTNLSQLTGLMEGVLKVAETASDTSTYDDLSDKTTVKIATLKSMIPIINEAKFNFDLYRDLEKDIEPIMQKLFDTSSKAVEKLADDYADSTSRSKLFFMLMQEAGTLYAASWHSETKKIADIMKQHSPEKLEKAIEKYKNSGGFPLNRIEHDFEKYFGKMIVITEKLVQSQKGTIEKRLKNK